MRLRGSHFASLQFCIRTQLIHFQDSQQLPSQPAPFMKRNFSWCFYILEWDKVSIWVYLPHNSLPCQRPISLISICLSGFFFLFYRIMIIPPVVSFGTLISLISNFSQKSYVSSKVIFFGLCSKMQIIPIKNLNIKKVVPQFLWFLRLKC